MNQRFQSRIDQLLVSRLHYPELKETGPVLCVRDIAVPADDGVALMTDMWWPQDNPQAPVLLMRTPYGRGGLQTTVARLFARYGLRVVVQSCRGTDGDTEPWEPFLHEADDGLATVAWMRTQSWFTGTFAMYGTSYVGYTQWALASLAPPELAAMIICVAPLDPHAMFHREGTFHYEAALAWTREMPNPPAKLEMLMKGKARKQALLTAAETLPLIDGYREATDGARSASFESWLTETSADCDYWTGADRSDALERTSAAVLLVGGWHDLFAAETISHFDVLRARGLDAQLVMAASTHAGTARALPKTLPIMLGWLSDVFAGRTPAQSGAITLQDVGTKQWRSFQQWPPVGVSNQQLYLQAGGRLSPTAPESAATDHYRYDPADPTPSVGGELFALNASGDNRTVQARSDVLTYTTDPLDHDLQLAGSAELKLWFSTTAESVDVFARLSYENSTGEFRTICDAIRRLQLEPDDEMHVVLTLSPAVCTIAKGKRLRLQISSAAHPCYLRNTGTREPLATATTLRPSTQTVHLSPERPSSMTIQVFS